MARITDFMRKQGRRIPKTTITLAEKETLQVMHMLEVLEDLDDVDRVYSNLDIPDEVMAAVSA